MIPNSILVLPLFHFVSMASSMAPSLVVARLKHAEAFENLCRKTQSRPLQGWRRQHHVMPGVLGFI